MCMRVSVCACVCMRVSVCVCVCVCVVGVPGRWREACSLKCDVTAQEKEGG